MDLSAPQLSSWRESVEAVKRTEVMEAEWSGSVCIGW